MFSIINNCKFNINYQYDVKLACLLQNEGKNYCYYEKKANYCLNTVPDDMFGPKIFINRNKTV